MTTITFQVSVTNLPTVNPTPNTANIVYDFIFNPDFAPIQKSTTSNTTFVQINDADIVSLKTVDLTSVTIGDILTYTTTLTNTGIRMPLLLYLQTIYLMEQPLLTVAF